MSQTINLVHDCGYARVNGLEMYYEPYGSGFPLVMIHVGFGSTASLDPIVHGLDLTRQVIRIDIQGHGRTADIDRPLKFGYLADDVAGLLMHLGIAQADVMGYSLGGAIALHTAFSHPGAGRKLVVVAEPMKSEGWFPDTRSQFANLGPSSAEYLRHTRLHSAYAEIAPNPSDLEALHNKYDNLLSPSYDSRYRNDQAHV
jgi:pimeloyl-ACP methyl ester carboxylesterase